jgi:hypothetical protein
MLKESRRPSLALSSLICSAIVGLFSIPARAQMVGVFLEPMMTYQKGDGTTSWNTPLEKSSSTLTGTGFGLRLGYHFLSTLFLAADARYSQPEWKSTNPDLTAKATDLNYGVTLGVQPPIVGLRFWGTYVFNGSLDPQESQNFDVRFRKSQGYRLGGGFSFILVSLNLEYQELKNSDLELGRATSYSGLSANNTEMNSKTWIASLSIPFSF